MDSSGLIVSMRCTSRRGAQRGDGQRLRLAAREEAGAVRARQEADLDRDGPDGVHVAAVHADALVEHQLAHGLLVEQRGQAAARGPTATFGRLEGRVRRGLVATVPARSGSRPRPPRGSVATRAGRSAARRRRSAAVASASASGAVRRARRRARRSGHELGELVGAEVRVGVARERERVQVAARRDARAVGEGRVEEGEVEADVVADEEVARRAQSRSCDGRVLRGTARKPRRPR